MACYPQWAARSIETRVASVLNVELGLWLRVSWTPFRFGFARSGFFFGQLAPRRFELFFDSLQFFRLFDDQIFRGLQLLLKAGLGRVQRRAWLAGPLERREPTTARGAAAEEVG